MSADTGMHAPYPYVVVLRVSTNSDSAPALTEWRGQAYSLVEAAGQAIMETQGQLPVDATIKVQTIGPDVPAFLKMARELVAEVVKGKPAR